MTFSMAFGFKILDSILLFSWTDMRLWFGRLHDMVGLMKSCNEELFISLAWLETTVNVINEC